MFVGQSTRTNEDGVVQLQQLVEPFGYTVVAVPVTGCLHLKSAVTEVGPGTLLINPQWVPAALFAAYRLIEVDPREPLGANALLAGGSVIYSALQPRDSRAPARTGHRPAAARHVRDGKGRRRRHVLQPAHSVTRRSARSSSKAGLVSTARSPSTRMVSARTIAPVVGVKPLRAVASGRQAQRHRGRPLPVKVDHKPIPPV